MTLRRSATTARQRRSTSTGRRPTAAPWVHWWPRNSSPSSFSRPCCSSCGGTGGPEAMTTVRQSAPSRRASLPRRESPEPPPDDPPTSPPDEAPAAQPGIRTPAKAIARPATGFTVFVWALSAVSGLCLAFLGFLLVLSPRPAVSVPGHPLPGVPGGARGRHRTLRRRCDHAWCSRRDHRDRGPGHPPGGRRGHRRTRPS